MGRRSRNTAADDARSSQDKEDASTAGPKVKAVHYYHNASYHESQASVRTPTATAVTWKAPEDASQVEEQQDRVTAGWLPQSPQKKRKTRNAFVEEHQDQQMTMVPYNDDDVDLSFFCYQGLSFASQNHLAKEKVDEEAITVVTNNRTKKGLSHSMKHMVQKLAKRVLVPVQQQPPKENHRNHKSNHSGIQTRSSSEKQLPKEDHHSVSSAISLQTPPRVFPHNSTPATWSPSPQSSPKRPAYTAEFGGYTQADGSPIRSGALFGPNIAGSLLPTDNDSIPRIEQVVIDEVAALSPEERAEAIHFQRQQQHASTSATAIATTTIIAAASVDPRGLQRGPPLNYPFQTKRNLVVSTVAHHEQRRSSTTGPIDLDETPPSSPEESFASLPDGTRIVPTTSGAPDGNKATTDAAANEMDEELAMALDLNNVTITTTLDGSFAFQQHEVKFRDPPAVVEEDDQAFGSDVDLDVTAEDDGSFVPQQEDKEKWAIGPVDTCDESCSSILHQPPPSIRRSVPIGIASDDSVASNSTKNNGPVLEGIALASSHATDLEDASNVESFVLPSPQQHSTRQGPLQWNSLPKRSSKKLLPPLPPAKKEMPLSPQPTPTTERRASGPVDLDETIESSKDGSAILEEGSDWVASDKIVEEWGGEGNFFFRRQGLEQNLDKALPHSKKDGKVQMAYSGPPAYSGPVEEQGVQKSLSWPIFADSAAPTKGESSAKKAPVVIKPSERDTPLNALVLQHVIRAKVDAGDAKKEGFNADEKSMPLPDSGYSKKEGLKADKPDSRKVETGDLHDDFSMPMPLVLQEAGTHTKTRTSVSPAGDRKDSNMVFQMTPVGSSGVELGLVQPKADAMWNDADESMDDAKVMKYRRALANTEKEAMNSSPPAIAPSDSMASLDEILLKFKPAPKAAMSPVGKPTPFAEPSLVPIKATPTFEAKSPSKEVAPIGAEPTAEPIASDPSPNKPLLKLVMPEPEAGPATAHPTLTASQVKPKPLDKRPQRRPPPAFKATQARLPAVWEEPRSRSNKPVDLDESIDTNSSEMYTGPVDVDAYMDTSSNEEVEASAGLKIDGTKNSSMPSKKEITQPLLHSKDTEKTKGAEWERKWAGIIEDMMDDSGDDSVYFTDVAAPKSNKYQPPKESKTLWTEAMLEISEGFVGTSNNDSKNNANIAFNSPANNKGWMDFPITPATAHSTDASQASGVSPACSSATPRKIPQHPHDTLSVSQRLAQLSESPKEEPQWFDFVAADTDSPLQTSDAGRASDFKQQSCEDKAQLVATNGAGGSDKDTSAESGTPRKARNRSWRHDHDNCHGANHDIDQSDTEYLSAHDDTDTWSAEDILHDMNTNGSSKGGGSPFEGRCVSQAAKLGPGFQKTLFKQMLTSKDHSISDCSKEAVADHVFCSDDSNYDETTGRGFVRLDSAGSGESASSLNFGKDDSQNAFPPKQWDSMEAVPNISEAEAAEILHFKKICMQNAMNASLNRSSSDISPDNTLTSSAAEDMESAKRNYAGVMQELEECLHPKPAPTLALQPSYSDLTSLSSDELVTKVAHSDNEKNAVIQEESKSFIEQSIAIGDRPLSEVNAEIQQEINRSLEVAAEAKVSLDVTKLREEIKKLQGLAAALKFASERAGPLQTVHENKNASADNRLPSMSQDPNVSTESSGNDADDEGGLCFLSPDSSGEAVEHEDLFPEPKDAKAESSTPPGDEEQVMDEVHQELACEFKEEQVMDEVHQELAREFKAETESRDTPNILAMDSGDHEDSSATPKRANKGKKSVGKRLMSALKAKLRGSSKQAPDSDFGSDRPNTPKHNKSDGFIGDIYTQDVANSETSAYAYDFRQCLQPCEPCASPCSSSLRKQEAKTPQKQCESERETVGRETKAMIQLFPVSGKSTSPEQELITPQDLCELERDTGVQEETRAFADFREFEKEEQLRQEEEAANSFVADFSNCDVNDASKSTEYNSTKEASFASMKSVEDVDQSTISSSVEVQIHNPMADDSFCETALLAADFQRDSIGLNCPPGSFPSHPLTPDTVDFTSKAEDAAKERFDLEGRVVPHLLDGVVAGANVPPNDQSRNVEAYRSSPKTSIKPARRLVKASPESPDAVAEDKMAAADGRTPSTISPPQPVPEKCTDIRQKQLFPDRLQNERQYDPSGGTGSKRSLEEYDVDPTPDPHFDQLVEALVQNGVESDGPDPNSAFPSCPSSDSEEGTHQTSMDYSLDTDRRNSILVETVGFDEEFSVTEEFNPFLDFKRPEPDEMPVEINVSTASKSFISAASLPTRSKSMHNISITTSKSVDSRRSLPGRSKSTEKHLPPTSVGALVAPTSKSSRSPNTSQAQSQSHSMSLDTSNQMRSSKSRSKANKSPNKASAPSVPRPPMPSNAGPAPCRTIAPPKHNKSKSFSAVGSTAFQGSFTAIRDLVGGNLPDFFTVREQEPVMSDPRNISRSISEGVAIECTFESFARDHTDKQTIPNVPSAPEDSQDEKTAPSPNPKEIKVNKQSPAGVSELESYFDFTDLSLESSGYTNDTDEDSIGNAPRSIGSQEDLNAISHLDSVILKQPYTLGRSETPDRRTRTERARQASAPISPIADSSEDCIMPPPGDTSKHSFGMALFPDNAEFA